MHEMDFYVTKVTARCWVWTQIVIVGHGKAHVCVCFGSLTFKKLRRMDLLSCFNGQASNSLRLCL